MTSSLIFLALLTHTVSADAPAMHLIAHRGGVVDAQHIENNLPGIEEAVRRGYWMLEVDIRESKDGRLVVHHDEDCRRFYNDPRRVADMTWDEIKQLRSTPGNLRPLEFSEYAAASKGKIRLMLDTKGRHHDEAFYRSMLDTLRENDLLESAFVIGNDESRALLLGKAKVGIRAEALKAAAARGEDVAGRYFILAHAKGFDPETVALCRKHGVAPVPSINTFHYPADKHRQRAAADIARLKELGITHFQIDSVYEEACRKP
jgi:glycerophosphoryl diester phosphodiesterase